MAPPTPDEPLRAAADWDVTAGTTPGQLNSGHSALPAASVDQQGRGDLGDAARTADVAWIHTGRGDPSALERAYMLLVRGLLAHDTGDDATAQRLLDDAVTMAARATGQNAVRI